MLNIFKIFFIVAIAGTLLSACKKGERIPPVNPSLETLYHDLNFFNFNPDSVSYFNDASSKVLFWKDLINDSIYFQRNFYEMLIPLELQYQNNNTWLASKSVIQGGNTYNLNLFQIVDVDTLYSKMFISKDTLYNNLLLMNGINYAGLKGNWSINKPDTADTFLKVVDIFYKNPDSGNKNIEFICNLQGAFNGNSILIIDSIDNTYDSYIELYDKLNENKTYIQWNSISQNGRIRDNKLYGDLNWRNWNEMFLNEN